MTIKIFNQLMLAGTLLLSATAGRAQSAYSNAVIKLNPVAYWPLQETAQPPAANIETNVGTLGSVANAYYACDITANIVRGFGGATGDGDTAVEFAGNNQSFMIVPTTDNRVSLPAGRPFTVEGWRYPTSYNSYVTVVGQSGPVGGGGNNAVTASAGWTLDESWTPFRGTAGNNNPFRGWCLHVFNGTGFTGTYTPGAEAGAAYPYNLNQWYYIAGVFDGTNCTMYINGVNATSYQIPMTGSFVPDTWDPIEMGCERGLGANPTHGGLDEVAIYTNALTAAQILAHFNAASGAAYATTILNDNPYMYWRMDAPVPVIPSVANFPTAMNCGSLAASMTNFNTFGTNAVYQPGAIPGVAGPSYPGFGTLTNACAFNGIVGAVDAGYNSLMDPTGVTNNFTVVAWFRGNPMDINGRYNCLASHSDSSWKIQIKNGTTYGYKGASTQPSIAPATFNVNDGNWHMVTLESTYTNGVGTNVTISLDGGAISVVVTNTGAIPGKPTLDAFIGGAPDYLESTNGFGTYNTTPQQYFAGRIAHVAYFTNALTAAQIFNLYTNAGAAPLPPVIVSQPATGRTAGSGGVNGAGTTSYIYFGVQASGITPLAYQWYYNSSSNYNGATMLADGVKYTYSQTAQVTVTNLVNTDSGYYFVVVTNNYGSTTSILASLQISASPVITAQAPAGPFNAYVNQTPTLYVMAGGIAPFTYQWFTNGVADTTAGTASTYTLPSVQTAMTGYTYQCVVTNTYGSATGALNTLTVSLYPAALTNSAYSSNLLSLAPAAYWPMHEVEPAVPGDIETNYGTLGALGTAYYGDWDVNAGAPGDSIVFHQMTGALAGDSDPCIGITRGTGAYLVIPHTSPKVTLAPPFTLEAWVKPYDLTAGIIIGLGGGNGLNSSTNFGGFSWYWQNSANAFSFIAYTGSGSSSSETKTYNSYNPGSWYHLVTTYDGTNAVFYVNGSLAGLAAAPNVSMNLDSWSPLCIGGGRWNGNIQNLFSGAIDEVAIYTNTLSSADIQNHYNAGASSNPSPTYLQLVTSDNPLVYLRMDSPAYTAPPASTWPALTNYGATAINGVYTPGVAPGSVAGPGESGFPIAGLTGTNAVPFNGMSGFADAGFNQAFNPTTTSSFSYTFWFKGNPADDRFQTIIGHSDSSWRCAMATTGKLQAHGVVDFTSPSVCNDGNWHHAVVTYNGSTGNNVLYLDGTPVINSVSTSTNAGSLLDVILGGDPQYTNNPVGPGRQFAGELCEVAFFNGVVLNTNQVQSLYYSANVPAFILQQPISASANEGTAFTNTVVAGGDPTLSYQWYKNNQPLPFAGQTNIPAGATNASLILNPVLASDDSTSYYVVVRNSFGGATSAVWALDPVYSQPVITSDIANTNEVLLPGGHTSFAIQTIGAQPIICRWYSNNMAIAGATNSTYALTNAQPANSTITYYCIASNFVGTAQSLTATVTVLPLPAVPYPLAIMAGNPLGYWRLNEADNGSGNQWVVAHDYWAGNNGLYTNTILGDTGYNPNEPTETAARFGWLSVADCDVFSIPTNVDFSTTNGGSRAFSVECWANGYQQLTDAGIVTKGYSGGEQFNLDCGSDSITPLNPLAHSFRWFVRNAAGTTVGVSSSVNPVNGVWHHLVGVCDEANGDVAFYVDGLLVGTNTITPGSGILSSARAMTIGARSSNSATNNNWQFVGDIDDVSVYNYALSSNQVVAHYAAGQVPAFIVFQPTNTTASQNGTATFSVTASGAQPLSYQWFDANTGNPVLNSATIGGSTNATLVLNNVQNSDSYYLQVTNLYGPATTTTVGLTVVSGLPQIYTDLQSQYIVLEGKTISLPVTAYGTLPMTNQWQKSDLNAVNWTNLVDNGRITGSQSNVLTIANTQPGDAGDYRLTIANGSGGTVSSVATLTVLPLPVTFYNNAQYWTSNGSARFNNGGLSLTDPNNGGGTASFFFQIPQYVGAFKAAFTYQAQSAGNGLADGTALCLQDDPRGAAAIASGGGGLGLGNGGVITPSVELMLDIYGGSGYAFGTNGVNIPTSGATSPNFAPPGNVLLGSGDPIVITVNYANGQMALTFTDAVAATSFSTNILVGDITKVLGTNSAYIGFTGGYGGQTSVQTITNFSFVSIPTAAIQLNSGNALVSWPGPVLGYVLQQNSNLSTTNWANVTNLNILSNGLNQVALPKTAGSNLFYRLILQQ